MKIKGRSISKGKVSGEVLLSREPISFLGGVDSKNGKIIEKGHCLESKSISGKILVFTRGKGSTVGSYVMLQLKKSGVAPLGIITLEAETIISIGAIISNIPMIDELEKNPFEFLEDGQKIILDADNGVVEVVE